MGLSFSSVQKTYEVFHILKEEFLPELRIDTWPADMGEMDNEERVRAKPNRVIGWGKKSDDGWENIFFLVEGKPSDELVKRFEMLAKEHRISNSTMVHQFEQNKALWVIGWF